MRTASANSAGFLIKEVGPSLTRCRRLRSKLLAQYVKVIHIPLRAGATVPVLQIVTQEKLRCQNVIVMVPYNGAPESRNFSEIEDVFGGRVRSLVSSCMTHFILKEYKV